MRREFEEVEDETTFDFSKIPIVVLEGKFAIMKSVIEKGIYGDQFDRDLSAFDPVTGKRFNVYTQRNKDTYCI